MKTLSLKVPETLDRDLEKLASKRGMNKSSVIREAMGEHVARHKQDEEPSPKSFLARAHDLAGCLDDGPEDLSTQAYHLDGYGR